MSKKKPPVAPDGQTPERPPDGEIDPDELMGDISSLSFLKTSIISVVIHLVLIGATSIGFVMLCLEHDTLHPDLKVQEIARQKGIEKRLAERLKRQEQLLADRKAKGATSRGGGKEPDGGANGSGGRGKTPTERNASRKATTLPATSGVQLDPIPE